MTAKTKTSEGSKKTKVCYVVCYRDPNYIRTQVLVASLKKIKDIELIEVRNKRTGLWRYLEVPLKLFWARISKRPDVFFVGFRAHEIFWALYLLMFGKKIIFDEFIDHHDWLASEHSKVLFGENSILIKILDAYMGLVMRLSSAVLTDTVAHAELAVKHYKIPRQKVHAIPVGTDEAVFYPRDDHSKSDYLNLFFYGNMLPLHGLPIILDAIKVVTKSGQSERLRLVIAGGKGNPRMIKTITTFIRDNNLSSRVEYIPWIPYSDLPGYVAQADLCLGGPFGNTGQANRVITGKTFQFLAMSKPTIIGRIEELKGFKDKKNCLIVKQDSAGDLADAVLWALNNKRRLPEIGKAGRSLYQENFSQNIIAGRLRSLIG